MINSTRSTEFGNVALRVPVQNKPKERDIVVPTYFSRKVFWVRLLATVFLVICSPIMLLAMLLVFLTSPGPVLFRQSRVGKGGKVFDVLKIRTMHRDAETLCGPVLCKPGDSRITPVGRFLRLLHLDELPQLINVIRGEMCLIGPRPERPEIIIRHRLKETVPGFVERTKVLPGVTGLAQINLPPDQSAECVIPKVKLDLEYIESATASLDLRILLCTAMRMIGIRHGRAVRLFGLDRSVATCKIPRHLSAGQRINDDMQREHDDLRIQQSPTTAGLAYASSNGIRE
jgi:lipopolysaccharide/colanic/teichoic acid biosynthesis glycosyltransferase